MSLEKIDALLRQLSEESHRYIIFHGDSKLGWADASDEKEALVMWGAEAGHKPGTFRAELLDVDKAIDALDVAKHGKLKEELENAVGKILQNCAQWLSHHEGVEVDADLVEKISKKVNERVKEYTRAVRK